MMNYLIIANIYLILFYGFYKFFLARETFFQVNRAYLIGTTSLSFILPLIQLEWLQDIFRTSTVFVARSSLDAVTIYAGDNVDSVNAESGIAIPFWGYIYMSGLLVQLILVIRKFIHLKRRLQTTNEGDAYSFMHAVKVDVGQQGSSKILRHELIHVRQFHTLDVLFLELIKLFNWFNPVVYWLANSLKLTHEYIADEAVNTSQADKIAYAELLISRTFSVSSSVLTNNFLNQSFIKNRIVMLLKNKSRRPALLKYVLAVPLFISMLIFSSAKVSNPKDLSKDRSMKKEMSKTALTTDWKIRQDSTRKNVIDYNELDVQPAFPGGMSAFYKWIGENFKYSTEAKDRGISGTVLVSYIIEKDGTLNDIEVIEDLGYGTGQAALDLLKNSPKWAPGQKNGQAVRVAYTLPIKLNLSNPKPQEKTGQNTSSL